MENLNLTEEQKENLIAEYEAEKKAKKDMRVKEVETYKDLVAQTVENAFEKLQEVSKELVAKKKEVREAFATIIKMKQELYNVKQGQVNHQFMSSEAGLRIRLGFCMTDNYDDTVNAGIAKVQEYLDSLATSPETKALVDTVLTLLSKDSKGTMKASRVLQLQQMADKSENKEFLEGVDIIKNAYAPTESKSYIRAEYRDANRAWKTLPLGMTEAE